MTRLVDPRTKLAFIAAVFIAGLGASSWLGLGATFLGLVTWGLSVRLPLKAFGKALSSLSVLFLFTFLMHALLSPGVPVISLGPLAISYEGLWRGVWMVARLALLVSGATILTQTTSPLDLTQALESVLSPLRYIRIPVGEAAMIVGISIRFLPVLAAETQRIQEAQILRGHSVKKGSLLEGVRSLIPILVPLMGGALRRAEELGDAMAARAYSPGTLRTYLYPLQFTVVDKVLTAGVFAVSLSVALWL